MWQTNEFWYENNQNLNADFSPQFRRKRMDMKETYQIRVAMSSNREGGHENRNYFEGIIEARMDIQNRKWILIFSKK